jgi:hypothetical protein
MTTCMEFHYLQGQKLMHKVNTHGKSPSINKLLHIYVHYCDNFWQHRPRLHDHALSSMMCRRSSGEHRTQLCRLWQWGPRAYTSQSINCAINMQNAGSKICRHAVPCKLMHETKNVSCTLRTRMCRSLLTIHQALAHTARSTAAEVLG